VNGKAKNRALDRGVDMGVGGAVGVWVRVSLESSCIYTVQLYQPRQTVLIIMINNIIIEMLSDQFSTRKEHLTPPSPPLPAFLGPG